ncbi:MAG: hypothetical protein AB1457_18570, partial [Chloroflexota bacterium]
DPRNLGKFGSGASNGGRHVPIAPSTAKPDFGVVKHSQIRIPSNTSCMRMRNYLTRRSITFVNITNPAIS